MLAKSLSEYNIIFSVLTHGYMVAFKLHIDFYIVQNVCSIIRSSMYCLLFSVKLMHAIAVN